MDNKTVAVFDFDGTVVSRVTAYVFYKWLIKTSPIRVMLFFISLPLVLILVSNVYTRKHGFSIISYIATSFRRQNLFRIRSNFIEYYFTQSGAVVYSDALEKINQHVEQGHRVIILSGCPQWLLHSIMKIICVKNVQCIGSELTMCFTGLLFKNHCYSSKKIEIACRRGINMPDLTYGYADSLSDAPWLKYCNEVHAVN